MRNLFITFLILTCCTAGAAWAAETITEEEHLRAIDQGLDRFQEARELLKKSAEHNRKVEQTLAKIRAAWGADVKQAPEEPEIQVREHDRMIGRSLAKITADLQTHFTQASQDSETPVWVAESPDSGMETFINGSDTNETVYKKLILYRSPNNYVSVKPFFKKAAGISLKMKW